MKTTDSLRMMMIVVAMLLTIMTGCSDERVATVATQAADRQAEQNDTMAKLQQDVTVGTRKLVEADANARHDIVAVHHDLQAERSRLDTSWTALEDERRQLDRERQTESVLVPAVEVLGGVALVTVLFGFCWYVLIRLRADTTTDAELNALLVHELTAAEPMRLISQASPTPIAHDPKSNGT
jgi:hypothetical protein